MEEWETHYQYHNNQEWDKLVEFCLEELKGDPESDCLLWRLGDAYLQSGNYQKALEVGKYHYQIHPKSPNATQIVIDALEGLGRPVEDFPWKGSPKILKVEDAMDRVYEYMLHKRGRKRPINVCELYSNLFCSNEVLVGFSTERFEEKMRGDSRFNVGGIGEVSLSKWLARTSPEDQLKSR